MNGHQPANFLFLCESSECISEIIDQLEEQFNRIPENLLVEDSFSIGFSFIIVQQLLPLTPEEEAEEARRRG